MPERRRTDADSSISASTGTTDAPLLYVASTTVPRSSGIWARYHRGQSVPGAALLRSPCREMGPVRPIREEHS
jgi:hypothetical protein